LRLQNIAKIGMIRGASLVLRDGFANQLGRIIQPPGLKRNHTQQMKTVRMMGRVRQNLSIGLFRLRQSPRLMMRECRPQQVCSPTSLLLLHGPVLPVAVDSKSSIPGSV